MQRPQVKTHHLTACDCPHIRLDIVLHDVSERHRLDRNSQRGDGVRFRGRGLLQVTGRANYAACGKALGLDLLAQPELLEQSVNACRSAGWFWQTKGMNTLADAGDQERVTRRINGGVNGLAERLALYREARKVLA